MLVRPQIVNKNVQNKRKAVQERKQRPAHDAFRATQ
jgi:hypothetical protein